MKRLLFFLLVLSSFYGFAQGDKPKYSGINGYGFIYKRMGLDSVLLIPLSTSPHVPYRMGAIRYSVTDSLLDVFTGYQWISGIRAIQLSDSSFKVGRDTIVIGGAAYNLQSVTDRGPKTTDTIIAAGVRTQNIVADTIDQDDHTMYFLPDMQYYAETPYISILDSMFNHIVNNRITENVSAVMPVGDITDNATATEFIRIDTQVDKLDNYNIPFLPVIGNHDYTSLGGRLATVYNTYFGPARFTGKPYYGGSMDGGNENCFVLFEAGGTKYIGLSLEFIPRDTAINWAHKILDSLPDRQAIIVTHAYIARTGERSTDTTQWASASYGLVGNDGDEMWEKLIRRHKQIFLVVNGHFLNSVAALSGPVVKRITESGRGGNIVYQIVCNYQMDTLGGNGYMMKLKFKPRSHKINVSFYSPYLGYEDGRFPSYDLDYPAIKMGGVVGISDEGGGLNVAGEVRFDSAVSITGLPKGRVVTTEVNGKLITLADQPANYFLASPSGAAGIVAPRLITAADLPASSTNYIQNQVASAQTGNFWINGISVVSDRNYPSSGFQNNFPGRAYFVHGPTNYGLTVTRAENDGGAANIVLFKTRNSNASVRTSVANGDVIGDVSFQGVAGDNSTISRAAEIQAIASTPQSTYVPGSLGFYTTNAAGTAGIKMRFSSEGNLYIGGNVNSLYGLQVNKSIAQNKDSSELISSITSETVQVIDTLTGKFKRIYLNSLIVNSAVTSINSMLGPAITIQGGTATSVSSGSNSVTVNVTPSSLALPHTLNKQYADANNSGTSETDLYTYTLPANTLTIDGRSIHFEASGTLNDATTSTQLRMYFAGTAFGNTGAIGASGTGYFSLIGHVIRTGSTTARAYVTFKINNIGSDQSFSFEADLTGLDFTVGNILKLTGQASNAGASSNDITGKTWVVTYWPE